MGDNQSALDSYKNALKIREGLRENNPESDQYASDSSVSYDRIGDIFYYQEELQILKEELQTVISIEQSASGSRSPSATITCRAGCFCLAWWAALCSISKRMICSGLGNIAAKKLAGPPPRSRTNPSEEVGGGHKALICR